MKNQIISQKHELLKGSIMKKKMAAALLILLLFISAPFAQADTIYSNPDPAVAGAEMDYLFAVLDEEKDVFVQEGALPDGIYIEEEPYEEGVSFYLRGASYTAGDYGVLMHIGDTSVLMQIVIKPSVPSVITSPDVSCYPGDEAFVSVSASTDDGGTLSYQWYSSPTSSIDYNIPVPGATAETLAVDTSRVGATYYYCVVTNTNNGESSIITSPIISVTIEELSVEEIAVSTLPNKTEYAFGSELDTNGLSILVKYSNGTAASLNEGFGVYPTELTVEGTQTITVSYGGQETAFTVIVAPEEEVINGIGVLTLPTKSDYLVGEQLNPAGLSIRAYTNKGRRDISEGLDCTPLVFTLAGQQTVTVTYKEHTCTFTVSVREPVITQSIAIAKLPSKTEYLVGDTLDPTGLALTVTDSEGIITIVSSGYSCSPSRLDNAGTQPITVTYDGYTANFRVTVLQSVPSPSPTVSSSPTVSPSSTVSPSPTVEPSPSPSPAVTPVPFVTPTPNRHASGNLAIRLMGVIVITGLFAASVLLGYLYVINNGGFKTVWESIKNRFQKKK